MAETLQPSPLSMYGELMKDSATQSILEAMGMRYENPSSHEKEIEILLELLRTPEEKLTRSYRESREKLAQQVTLTPRVLELYLKAMRNVKLGRSFQTVKKRHFPKARAPVHDMPKLKNMDIKSDRT